MNIILNGICGKMGMAVRELCERGYRGASISAGVDPSAHGNDNLSYRALCDIDDTVSADCIVDFSHHTCIDGVLEYAKANRIAAVIATTGHTDGELDMIYEAAKTIPVFFSANMSLGVALLVELAKTAALAMPEAEIEIVEKHHDRKIDAPSGTALMLANAICEVRPGAYTNIGRSGQGKRTRDEIGIHAIRMGNIVGEHEVIVGTDNQTITLKHEAHSRALFAEGAIAAAAFVVNKAPGLYDMNSLISESKRDTALSTN